jgi:hypothetical protein
MPIKSDQIRSNPIKSDQIRSNQIKSDQIRLKNELYIDLTTGRYGHACGVLRTDSGLSSKVVVAGGYGVDGLLAETEILDLESGVWSPGPPVAAFAAGVYFRQLFLLRGSVRPSPVFGSRMQHNEC